MIRGKWTIAMGVALCLLMAGAALATTRDVAEMGVIPLTADQSVISQLTYDIFRDPWDELQSRPYNLLFANIDRRGNLSPWPGQRGTQQRFLTALFGNNGNTNVSNGADVIQGGYIDQLGRDMTYGASFSFISDDVGSRDQIGGSNFADDDKLSGIDARFSIAKPWTEKLLLGGGVTLFQRNDEITDTSFESGSGGFFAQEETDQLGIQFDGGVRKFINERRSWEAQGIIGFGGMEQQEFSETLDGVGVVSSRFVAKNYEASDLYIKGNAGYNLFSPDSRSETQYRAGLSYVMRDLDNNDLSFEQAGGVTTPNLTLVGSDAITFTTLSASAGRLFHAGARTQLFGKASLDHLMVSGSTRADSLGTIVNEEVDDNRTNLGFTFGLRQPLWDEKFRLIVRGHADFTDAEIRTEFDTAINSDQFTRTTTNFALGIEGVLANVTFDMAWLFGEDTVSSATTTASTVSRQVIEFDKLVVAAVVGW